VGLSEEVIKARQALDNGALIHLPTETVYGLAGRCDREETVASIFALKGRPAHNPLIVHVANTDLAKTLSHWNEWAEILTKHFWPGPLSLVLPARQGKICLTARGGLDTVALRSPDHKMALEVLSGLDFGVVAPSANRSGRPSPTDQAAAFEETGSGVAMSLDGGACKVGIESTVISLIGEKPALLRTGIITLADLEAFIGPFENRPDHAHLSPGRLSRHYAPKSPLIIDCLHPPEGSIYIGFGYNPYTQSTLNLSLSGCLSEASYNLFRLLRYADSLNPSVIAVAPVPQLGLGEAINDRLKRAAGYVG
jgi:L-threonylcarbamoyladenylate synthase